MVKWKPEVSPKDVVQIGVLVIGLTLALGRLEASTQANGRTLEALQQIQSQQSGRILKLEMERADRAGYERAKKELKDDG